MTALLLEAIFPPEWRYLLDFLLHVHHWFIVKIAEAMDREICERNSSLQFGVQVKQRSVLG